MTTFDKFNYDIVKNPEVFKVNVMPAHSDHIAYENEMQMLAGETGMRYSLNGLWKFHYARNYEAVIPGFEKPEYDCSSWDTIHVPAHIQMEGYDTPAYVNTQYPWDGREEVEPGEIPQRFNPVASYVKYFEVPEHMRGRKLFISFQGVESGYALWLNGSYVGYSEDTFTPSEFDLTPYVSDGINKLAVQVFKWTASSWLEDQDFYRFSGIFRDVYLFIMPQLHVYDLKVRTIVDDTYTNAELELTMKIPGAGSGSEIGPENSAENAAADNTGNSAEESGSAGVVEYALFRKGDLILGGTAECGEQVVVRGSVDRPHLWSAEDPQLYDLLVTVRNRAGRVEELIPQKVGFRRFEMKDGIMCINGKRIVFNGVNRHEFSCDTGRVPDRDLVLQDIITMKRSNINAVRTCHYPNATSILYDLCDEYGLYMIAENNMETHGTWDLIERGIKPHSFAVPGDRPEYRQLLLDRVNSCYQRDKNHPSIVIWSDGNESFGGSNIKAMTELFHRLDPDRLVHYEGIFHDNRYPETSDMYSQMYTSAAGVREFISEHTDKPFILCEYTHSMGNSNGGMHKYIELSEEEPRYQGGFIWDYVDQAIRRKNRYGRWFQAYGGDCGERPTDYDFSGNGIVSSRREEYPKLQDVRFNYQMIRAIVKPAEGKVTLINKNNFINTGIYDCTVTVEKEGRLVAKAPLAADVPPLSEKTFDLPVLLPGTAQSEMHREEKNTDCGIFPAGVTPCGAIAAENPAGEYTVTVSFTLKEDTLWAPRGYEVAFGQGVYRVYESGAEEGLTSGLPGRKKRVHDRKSLRIVHDGINIGVAGENFDVLFSGLKGGLVSYRYAGRELIESIPRPNFWRAPTQNDNGNQMAARYGMWKLASLYGSYIPFEHNEEAEELAGIIRKGPKIMEQEDCICVSYPRFLPTVPASVCMITYRVYGDGTVRMALDYEPKKGVTSMPEFGFLFRFNADFDTVTWYGNGPDENYCDRREGAKLGVYTQKVADAMTDYLVPQECGNKTEVRWAEITDHRGRGILFTCGNANGDRSGETDHSRTAEKAVNGGKIFLRNDCVGRSGNSRYGMDFSALPYDPEQIEEAQHSAELPEVFHTVVRCSMQQMGIGGDDSWGARTLDEYLLDISGPLHFEMGFRGI